MRKAVLLFVLFAACLVGSNGFAEDGFFVIPVGTRSIGWNDVVELHGYITPDSTVVMQGGIGFCAGLYYTIPADKMLVITTVHIRPRSKSSGTYRYRVYLQNETPPSPGPTCELWTFALEDTGAGVTKSFNFTPGIIAPGGDMVTVLNDSVSSDAVSVQLMGYLVNK